MTTNSKLPATAVWTPAFDGGFASNSLLAIVQGRSPDGGWPSGQGRPKPPKEEAKPPHRDTALTPFGARFSPGAQVLGARTKAHVHQLLNRPRLDITPSARRYTGLEVPTSVTTALWQSIAQGRPFSPDDELVQELCAHMDFAFTHLFSGHCFERTNGHSFDCHLALSTALHKSTHVFSNCQGPHRLRR